jgi:hypothetical protein
MCSTFHRNLDSASLRNCYAFNCEGSTVDEAGLKTILRALVTEVEDLRANQVVLVATLQKQSKVNRLDFQMAVQDAKQITQQHYTELRQIVDEIS